MTTPPALAVAMKNLDDAIVTFSNDARSQYYKAHDTIANNPGTAALEAAQKELMGAFAQLSTAARLESDQSDRDGFAAVVKLMHSTADAADKVSAKLVGLLRAEPGDTAQPQPNDYQLISELINVLDVLARLSPSAVWTTPRSSSKSD
jgi:hypothetical protein